MSAPGRALRKRRVAEICDGLATAFGASIACEITAGCPPTINHPEQVAVVAAAARRVVGQGLLDQNCAPLMSSEDFSFMLEQRPGAFFFVGQDGPGCHHPSYDFDEEIMAIGAGDVRRDRSGAGRQVARMACVGVAMRRFKFGGPTSWQNSLLPAIGR